MGTSLLSPMAKPFQPSYHDMDNNIMEFAIFNNGVPSSVYYGVHPEHEVLHNISDDALDERFPPSAADVRSCHSVQQQPYWKYAVLFFLALFVTHIIIIIIIVFEPPFYHNFQAAEMDAAEEFVEFMAWLSYLDECDEEARFTFCDIKKRWEARRAQGLVGKPHHPRTTSSTSMTNDKRFIKANNVDETTLVSFVPSQKNNKKGGVKIDKRRLLGPKKLMAKGSAIHGYSCAHPTIHQPRKHN